MSKLLKYIKSPPVRVAMGAIVVISTA